MIDRVPQGGAAHRVIGAEGGEPLPHAHGEPRRPVVPPQNVDGGDHQLVGVGVRMAPVVEALAPAAGRQLAAGHGPALEIEGAKGPQPATQQCGMSHEQRLHQAALGEAAAAGHRVHPGHAGDPESHQVHTGRGLAREGRQGTRPQHCGKPGRHGTLHQGVGG